MAKRTKSEKFADNLDTSLSVLLQKLQHLQNTEFSGVHNARAFEWVNVACCIRSARSILQSHLMHPEDAGVSLTAAVKTSSPPRKSEATP